MCQRNRILAAALAAALGPFAAHGATLCVNPGGTSGCFATIAGAVAAAAPGGDTISVAAGTYNETNINVSKPVNIVGAGRDATIVDGSFGGVHVGTVFRFRPGTVVAGISDLTVRNGRRGIDLGLGHTVTLERLRVTGNGPETGAGIVNNSSVMHLRDSLVDNNFATDAGSVAGCDWGGASGGGIASLCGSGWNFISGTTITGNTAGHFGGGLLLVNSVTVIENSTISGNQANFPDPGLAGGGLFAGGGDVTIRFSTIASNGAVGAGGLWVDDNTTKVFASVIQGNAGKACTGQPTSLGYNVVSDASCAFTMPGDAVSTDAMLLPLADIDGTLMHALPATSPAVDRVPAEACNVAVDQGGVARPQHHACDSGSYERVWTVTDLGALLLTQMAGATPGNSHLSQVSQVLDLIGQGKTRPACNVLRMLESTGGNQAYVGTVQDLERAVGC